ncbi:MAG: hypothetical protein BRD55_08615 [Bacteroidetes bacterium SW_9_63_38]|nr:MAG: hypothetical protein BRD55_08615 [Bacteroidetes bacterium SW_9_63_38]
MTLSPDFREFIRLLNAHSVRYLVVGGYAVAFHGHPRYTKDLDVWVDPTAENARRLLSALDDFGFGGLDLEERDFVEPDTVVQLGHPPNRIDLLASLDGVSFEESFAGRRQTDVGGTGVAFIGLDALRKNKRASGRHQDLADLENLEGNEEES